MKRRHRPIEVRASAEGNPLTVWYPSNPREVARVLDAWEHAGRWWLGESERRYYLVRLMGGLVLELYQEDAAWTLSAIHD